MDKVLSAFKVALAVLFLSGPAVAQQTEGAAAPTPDLTSPEAITSAIAC